MTETAWEAKTLPKKMQSRQTEMEKVRNVYDDSMADVIDFCQPGLTDWYSTTEGSFRGEKIYEGTPAWALRVMTNGWLGNLVSESEIWRRFQFPDKRLRDNDDINQWLQDLDDLMYSTYRSESDFYQMMPPFARCAFSVGSPVMIIFENKKTHKIECEVPHPKENYHGPMGAYHRKYPFTAMEAVEKFLKGKYPQTDEEVNNSKLSRALLETYRNGNHFTRFNFIRAIYCKDDPILAQEKKEYKNHEWMEFYIQESVGDNEQGSKEPILFQGYDTKPHVRWDYEINDDEFYARTPAWMCMMDVKSQQEMAKQMLEAGQRSLHPAQWVRKDYKGHFSDAPKARNWFNKTDSPDALSRQVQENIRYDIGVDYHDRLRTSVERWFHVPLFQLLSQLAVSKQGWPTATQTLRMDAEKVSQLSGQLGCFTGSVLRQIDERFFDIKRRAGQIPQPPDIVLEYMQWRKEMFGDTKISLGLKFLGPLAQVQQKNATIQRTELALAIIDRYRQIDENIPRKIRLSKSLERDLEEIGYAQDCIVPEPEYQETLAAIAQQQQDEINTQKLIEAAKTVPALGKKVEAGSVLGDMQGKEETEE